MKKNAPADRYRYFNICAIDSQGSPRSCQLRTNRLQDAVDLLASWGVRFKIRNTGELPLIAGYIFDTWPQVLFKFKFDADGNPFAVR